MNLPAYYLFLYFILIFQCLVIESIVGRFQNKIMLKSLLQFGRVGLVRSFSTSAVLNEKLSDKVAVVTASTEGIGYAIAKKLGLDGAHVVISSRKEEKVVKALEALKSDGINASGTTCHAAKAADRKALLKKVNAEHGRVDILVCNAGVNPYFGKTLDIPESAYDKIFDINVKSTFMLIKEAVPLIKKSESGSIIIVSSIAGLEPFDLLGVYSVSKTALLGLTKALSPELAAMNIRINCIAPGLVDTKFSKALLNNPQAFANIPMQRAAEPDECAGIVSFLASVEASYMTGETIVVGGGMKSRL